MTLLIGYDHMPPGTNKKVYAGGVFEHWYPSKPNGLSAEFLLKNIFNYKHFDFVNVCRGGNIPHKVVSTSEQIIGKYIYPMEPHGYPNMWMDSNIFSNVPDKVLDDINANRALFFLNVCSEGYVLYEIFEEIHKEIKRLGILHSNIVIATGNLRAERQYDSWCVNNNINDRIGVISFESCATTPTHFAVYPYPHKVSPRILSKYQHNLDRKYKYLFLAGRIRPTRMAAVTFLYRECLLDVGLASFPKTDVGIHYIEDILPNSGYGKDWVELQKQLPFLVDNKNPGPTLSYTQSRWTYADSYFNIVPESSFTSDSTFITEKTYKPIINMQPFVVMAPPGHLKCLKQLGYETYDKWIDESYDITNSHTDRILKVLDEIKRLSLLSNRDWDLMYVDMLPVLEHNYITNFYRSKLILEEFISRITSYL